MELDEACQRECETLLREVADMRQQVKDLQERMRTLQPSDADLGAFQVRNPLPTRCIVAQHMCMPVSVL